jgi:uncharacterized membrane protein
MDVSVRPLSREVGAGVERRAAVGTRALVVVGFALLVVVLVALQSWHFSGANYRDDEIRTTHAGMTMTIPEVITWMSVDIHPPLWRVSATTWVGLFGPDEPITRWLSSLYTALALAFLFRLALDLFDGQTALLAVFVLGTHALFMFYSHELRPYAALILWTNALHLAFVRWLRRPSFRYALLYVLFGTAALYTHFFALYVIAAQAVALVVLARWKPGVYVRAAGLFALAGLSFAGWLPSFLHSFLVTKPGGVDYGISGDLLTPSYLYNLLQLRPATIGNVLVGFAVLLALTALWRTRRRMTGDPVFRFGTAWRTLYFVVIGGAVFALVLLSDRWVDVLTRRNLLILIPPLAMLAAIGLRALPIQARLVAVILIALPAVDEFIQYEDVQPYREIADLIEPTYEAHEPVIISVDNGTGAYFAFAYYLMDRMPGRLTQNDMDYLTLGEMRVNLPEAPLNVIEDDSAASEAQFRDLIDDASRVWWVTSDHEPPQAETFRRILEANYTLADTTTIDEVERYGAAYRVDVYQRTDGGS